MGPEVSGSSSIKAKSHIIPRLATGGSNWITGKQQTLNSLLSLKGVHRHIQGTIHMPPPVPMYPQGHILDKDELDELEKIEEKWDFTISVRPQSRPRYSPQFLKLQLLRYKA